MKSNKVNFSEGEIGLMIKALDSTYVETDREIQKLEFLKEEIRKLRLTLKNFPKKE